ncbi:MAG TPA: aminoglycoside 6'-N-acetyltransferase [Steroidobacteraceae bacterium]|jgi:GNAT superfamily N-acetyltransferase|nr:aminoglycoside 6'-N-acetyltransferase [Steroidobacteraceae bacterium]
MQAPTPSRAVTIRGATAADVPTVLSFIRELAVYERLGHEVLATEVDLHAALFGSRAYAEVALACLQGEPVGFALFFHNFSTLLGKPGIYLEDLYVRPQARGLGAGKRLLAYLAKTARERGCVRLEWTVLDWNEPSIAFYRGLGAVANSEWTTYRMQGEALRRLADECPSDNSTVARRWRGRLIAPRGSGDRDWLALRLALWPDEEPAAELAAMAEDLRRDFHVRLAVDDAGAAVGFVEGSMRTDYVNGTRSSPVAFLEGLYVVPEFRHLGVARALVESVAEWARSAGCAELASDSLLDNRSGHAAHRALGFEETERVVYFRRALSAE